MLSIMLAGTLVLTGDVKGAPKATDGSLRTWCYSSKDISTVEIKMDRIHYIDRVEFWWKEPPKSYSVDVSYDFINWKNVVRNYDCRGLPAKKSFRVSSNELFGEVVQVFKVTVRGPFKLAEVKVFRMTPQIEIVRTPRIVKIERNRAVFEFATNYPTMAQISYSKYLDKVETDQAVMDVSIRKYHKIAIGPLSPGERYFAKAVIRDAEGREVARSEVVTFYTKGDPNPYLDYLAFSEGEFSLALFMRSSVVSTFEGILISSDGRKKFFKDDYPAKERYYVVEGLEPDTTYSLKLKIYNKVRSKYSIYQRQVSTKPWNLAYQKPVRGTFKNPYIADLVTLSGDILSRAVDGSFSYLYGMANSFDPHKEAQWLMVDMEEVYPLKEVIMYWREAAYPEDYQLLLSVDGRNWNKFKEHIDAGKYPTIRGRQGDLLKKVSIPCSLKARYVKIYIPKGAPYHKKIESYRFVQLFELEVLGDYSRYKATHKKEKGGER